MAKVKYTAFIADMRNSVAATTFSKNKAGAYSKTKPNPINPSTTDQVRYRGYFAEISEEWRGLTDGQRLSWTQAQDRWKRSDIFGAVHSPSGYGAFMRVNLQRYRVGGSLLILPPNMVAMPVVNSVGVTFVNFLNIFVVSFTLGNLSNMNRVVIRVTPQVSAGVMSFGHLLADIKNVPVTDVNSGSLHALYVAKYGAFIVGMRVGYSVVVVNEITGQVSQELKSSFIVA